MEGSRYGRRCDTNSMKRIPGWRSWETAPVQAIASVRQVSLRNECAASQGAGTSPPRPACQVEPQRKTISMTGRIVASGPTRSGFVTHFRATKRPRQHPCDRHQIAPAMPLGTPKAWDEPKQEARRCESATASSQFTRGVDSAPSRGFLPLWAPPACEEETSALTVGFERYAPEIMPVRRSRWAIGREFRECPHGLVGDIAHEQRRMPRKDVRDAWGSAEGQPSLTEILASGQAGLNTIRQTSRALWVAGQNGPHVG